MVPSPWHSLHAPWGELKEKLLGSICGMSFPGWSGQTNASENLVSSPLSASRSIIDPSPRFKHSSMESASLVRFGLLSPSLASRSLITMRSTIISMLCAFFGSSSISSSTVRICPSILIRTNPSRRILSSILMCDPFLPSTAGASRKIFFPCGIPAMVSTIWLGDCLESSLPHSMQCTLPALVQSRRM